MKRATRPTSFLVNGYPDGEMAGDQIARSARRAAALERWRRMQNSKRLRKQLEETPVTKKLTDMEPLSLLDCTYATQDLFNAVPRLDATQQATLIDYIEMRLDIWRKTNGPPEAPADE